MTPTPRSPPATAADEPGPRPRQRHHGPPPPPLVTIDPAPQPGRRFAVLAVAWLLVGWAGIVATNVAVDPRGEFGTGWLPPITEPPGGVFGAKLGLAARDDAGATAVLLGSSTAMQVRASALDGTRLGPAVNLAAPNTVLRGIEPALMAARAELPSLRHAVVLLDLHGLVALERGDATGPEPGALLRAATTRAYAEDSVRSLWAAATGAEGPPARFEANGDLAHDEALGGDQRGTPKFHRHATLYDVPVLDAAAVTALEGLVANATRAGMAVTLVLQPLHPDMVEHARSLGVAVGERRGDAEALLDRLCAPDVAVLATQGLEGIAWDPADFTDGIHYGRASGHLMAQAIAQRATTCA